MIIKQDKIIAYLDESKTVFCKDCVEDIYGLSILTEKEIEDDEVVTCDECKKIIFGK